MDEPEKFTLDEAHLKFAKMTNGRVWQLLEQASRTSAEDEEMVAAAWASLYHWQHAGTVVNAQRGHWLLAHVYTVLEQPLLANQHAVRCLELTEQHKGDMKDFDLPYAYEAMARALALKGKFEPAKMYYDRAREAGEVIANAEDKEIFLGDFESGRWYGLAQEK